MMETLLSLRKLLALMLASLVKTRRKGSSYATVHDVLMLADF